MPLVSFIDPVFDFEIIERMLGEIESLITEKGKKHQEVWDKWIKENESEKVTNPDYYYHMESGLIDENYVLSELERNLFNGVALTLGTIFEMRVALIVREMNEMDSSIHNPRKRIIMRDFSVWFPRYLEKLGHLNIHEITSELLDSLQTYVNIRNIIAHHDGFVREEDEKVKQFVNNNGSLFSIKNDQLWQISVKAEYIHRVIEDQKRFFNLVCYTKSGDVIF